MAIRFAPVDDFASKRGADIVVRVTMRLAAIRNTGALHATQHGIEGSIVYAKTVVPLGEFGLPLVEVDGKAVADIDRGKRTDLRGTPRYSKQ